MLFIGKTGRIYTIDYADKQWQQYDDTKLKLKGGKLLTSQECFADYKIKIKGVNIFTFNGWVRWAGIDNDYFKMVSTPDDNYKMHVSLKLLLKIISDYISNKPDLHFLSKGYDQRSQCFIS